MRTEVISGLVRGEIELRAVEAELGFDEGRCLGDLDPDELATWHGKYDPLCALRDTADDDEYCAAYDELKRLRGDKEP